MCIGIEDDGRLAVVVAPVLEAQEARPSGGHPDVESLNTDCCWYIIHICESRHIHTRDETRGDSRGNNIAIVSMEKSFHLRIEG